MYNDVDELIFDGNEQVVSSEREVLSNNGQEPHLRVWIFAFYRKI